MGQGSEHPSGHHGSSTKGTAGGREVPVPENNEALFRESCGSQQFPLMLASSLNTNDARCSSYRHALFTGDICCLWLN